MNIPELLHISRFGNFILADVDYDDSAPYTLYTWDDIQNLNPRYCIKLIYYAITSTMKDFEANIVIKIWLVEYGYFLYIQWERHINLHHLILINTTASHILYKYGTISYVSGPQDALRRKGELEQGHSTVVVHTSVAEDEQ